MGGPQDPQIYFEGFYAPSITVEYRPYIENFQKSLENSLILGGFVTRKINQKFGFF